MKPARDARKDGGKVERIEERSTPPTPVIYEIVRRYGEEEMSRPAVSLWWSGLAAGLSMSFSLLAEAILRLHLPDAPWRALVTSLGYPVGFLMVVLSRQQLFTENTVTAVLPVMAERSLRALARLGRMWGIVLAANLAGTALSALLCSFTPVVGPEIRASMLDVSREGILQHDWLEMLFRGVSSGYLMAAMVWLVPSAQSAQFRVVFLMTYLIGVGGFAHIVAGSVEAFLLLANAQLEPAAMLAGFTLPVLVGNIIGGTVLFALLSYGQVMKEV